MTFSTEILSWYKENARSLPWRHPHNTPYNVLISEIMLQQTQVSRVIEKFHEFKETFPTLQDLASASKADVIQSWSGLGYNRRALMLHKFAQEVMSKYSGVIPSVPEALIKLPGIGPYTAGSISSFAFNRPEPAIDVNVRRIFYRFFHGRDQGLPENREKEKQLFTLVKETIPDGRSSDFHNALMDFGSSICTRDSPSCSSCPMQSSCKFAPLYEENKGVLFTTKKRVEPGIVENGKHIPNRIFRGRIVEWVRNNNNKPILINDLGKVIKKDYSEKNKEWLVDRCLSLEKDSLLYVNIENNKITLQLAE